MRVKNPKIWSCETKRIISYSDGTTLLFTRKKKREWFSSKSTYTDWNAEPKQVVSSYGLHVESIRQDFIKNNNMQPEEEYETPWKNWWEYQLISKAYLGRKTSKGVPYINHIDEGLEILSALEASETTMRAYCVHPIFQENALLIHYSATREIEQLTASVVVLAMEYRSVANAALSNRDDILDNPENIKLSDMADVNLMLIADKVQNYKDFRKYNRDHKNAERLEKYFRSWLKRLNVTDHMYEELTQNGLLGYK